LSIGGRRTSASACGGHASSDTASVTLHRLAPSVRSRLAGCSRAAELPGAGGGGARPSAAAQRGAPAASEGFGATRGATRGAPLACRRCNRAGARTQRLATRGGARTLVRAAHRRGARAARLHHARATHGRAVLAQQHLVALLKCSAKRAGAATRTEGSLLLKTARARAQRCRAGPFSKKTPRARARAYGCRRLACTYRSKMRYRRRRRRYAAAEAPCSWPPDTTQARQ
jgi:hypothetical protein